MGQKDQQVDKYIDEAPPFARPILKHLRKLVHQVIPEVQESIKWKVPAFGYKGLFGGMSAFKAHVGLAIWSAPALRDTHGILGDPTTMGYKAMGKLGRITSMDELPPDEAIVDLLEQAKEVHDSGKKSAKAKPVKAAIEVPDHFVKALKAHKNAWKNFEAFSPSKKREYVEWITGAKTEKTRESRMATAVEWIAEGKSRNWKYER